LSGREKICRDGDKVIYIVLYTNSFGITPGLFVAEKNRASCVNKRVSVEGDMLFEFYFFVLQQKIKKKIKRQGNYASSNDEAEHKRKNDLKNYGKIEKISQAGDVGRFKIFC
jgi:hypothetical protein